MAVPGLKDLNRLIDSAQSEIEAWSKTPAAGAVPWKGRTNRLQARRLIDSCEHHWRVAGREGSLMPLRLSNGREVIVMITTADSPARAAGHNIHYQTCSERCSDEVSAAVRREMEPPV